MNDKKFIQGNFSDNRLNLGDSESIINEQLSLEVLKEDVTACFTSVGGKDSEMRDENFIGGNFSNSQNDHAILKVLITFNNILTLLRVKAVIIEPSILYCMLLPKYQELLMKRNFNISHFSRSKSIVTYGIMAQDVATLHKEQNKFIVMNFQPHFVQSPSFDWATTSVQIETNCTHILYKHKIYTIHMVVLHKRGEYLWLAALNSPRVDTLPPQDQLIFTAHNNAFEKFSFMSLESKMLAFAEFYVPSNVHYFLFEILSARFLECNVSRSPNLSSSNQPQSHPSMSVKKFNRRTRIALKELKRMFHPLLMDLWIWSGTLLGWYRQCDVIPYTSDVDFAAWASHVEDLDVIMRMLLNNKHVTIKQRMGFLNEALEFNTDCHGLRTDIFFMYPIQNGSWYSGHSPFYGYYFRYYHPPFTLCSGELLGEKVQVPCASEEVLEAEYGPDWRKPVSSWDYQTSIKNRGPNIYWKKNVLTDAYKDY